MAARQSRDEAPDRDTSASDPGEAQPIATAPAGGRRGGGGRRRASRRGSARLRAGRLATLLLLASAALVVAPAAVDGAARPSTNAGNGPVRILLETSANACSGFHTPYNTDCEELDSFTYSLIGKGAPTGTGLGAGGGAQVTPNQVTATMAADANSTAALFQDLATGRHEKAWTVYFVIFGSSLYSYLTITFKDLYLTSWTLTASKSLLPAVQITFQYQQASLQYFQRNPATGALTPVNSSYDVSKQAAA